MLDDGERVGLVVNGEIRLDLEHFPVPAEQADAKSVEGPGPDAGPVVADEQADALFQLVGGLVGEGDGEDALGQDVDSRTM